ncbi:MAG TPA: YbhB/YbcL family Raf kinase inhibitor-like protein [Terriglobia bacterium]|nr:YbhB/YbcL family Raf kinase inhibitor-like protein [Terriglobia bacterium]
MPKRSQNRAALSLILAGTGSVVLYVCGSTPTTNASGVSDSSPAALALRTSAFKPGGDIPAKFTCAGPNISPALDWGEPPSGTQSFTLIMDDPDAPSGTWVHWVVYDLPASTRRLPEGVKKGDALKSGGQQGVNDFGDAGYGGPCPPPGKPHRYFFKLYAVDKPLGLAAGVRKPQVESTLKGHILAQSELMGRFRR